MILSIMFVILSCKAATTPIDQKRTGKFVSTKAVSSDSYITVELTNDGGFKLYYSNDKGVIVTDGKENIVTGNEMRGEDPNYNFQTGVMGGYLQFLSNTALQITVTFNDGSASLKNILCYSTTA
ncbi:hypothetical protein R4I97_06030 [Brachyspira pilosicoli]|uniref:hypothetical protein n=1 Tax=Brachyspira pilosicoli TaxID=52584 RepID=UPI00300418AA